MVSGHRLQSSRQFPGKRALLSFCLESRLSVSQHLKMAKKSRLRNAQPWNNIAYPLRCSTLAKGRRTSVLKQSSFKRQKLRFFSVEMFLLFFSSNACWLFAGLRPVHRLILKSTQLPFNNIPFWAIGKRTPAIYWLALVKTRYTLVWVYSILSILNWVYPHSNAWN